MRTRDPHRSASAPLTGRADAPRERRTQWPGSQRGPRLDARAEEIAASGERCQARDTRRTYHLTPGYPWRSERVNRSKREAPSGREAVALIDARRTVAQDEHEASRRSEAVRNPALTSGRRRRNPNLIGHAERGFEPRSPLFCAGPAGADLSGLIRDLRLLALSVLASVCCAHGGKALRGTSACGRGRRLRGLDPVCWRSDDDRSHNEGAR
jgi:hypothetical protein